MGKINYYLVNHTQKEFCWLDAKKSVLQELEKVFTKYRNWSRTDEILIHGEDEAKAPDVWEFLTERLCFLDLNYEEHMCY